MNARVLFVDDEGEALMSLIRSARACGLEALTQFANNVETACEIIEESRPEVAVIDLSIDPKRGVESGFELLRRILQFDQSCRVIVLTGHGSLEYGVRSIQSGAASFLEKPADVPHLVALIADGIKQSHIRRAYIGLRDKLGEQQLEQMVVGESDLIQKVREEILFAVRTGQPVIFTGETGTGKGVCALALHRLGNRSTKPFVRYQPNYATPDLVRSELFGYRKGAFTGALSDRTGLLQEADGGTLFLDEIDELPHDTQVSLLHLLQERRFRAVGSNTEEEVDVRFVSASNRVLNEAIEQGKLRRDFFHRIAHSIIHLPPLRERLGDLKPLAHQFLVSWQEREGLNVMHVEDGVLEQFKQYDWPGNVREFQAAIEQAAFRAHVSGRTVIQPSDIIRAQAQTGSDDLNFQERVERFKLKLIREALLRNGGNQVRAARELGLDRSTMRRILERQQNFSSTSRESNEKKERTDLFQTA